MSNQAPEQTTTAPPSAETQNTESGHMIPKSRFDEVNDKAKALEARLAALETEQKAQLEAQLAEQGKYKELAEQRAKQLAEAQSKADKLEAYEATLQKLLDAEVEAIPEDKRGMIPAPLSTEQKLDWIAQNKAHLVKQAPPSIGAGIRGGSQEKSVEISQEEAATAKKFGMTAEEYAKYKQ